VGSARSGEPPRSVRIAVRLVPPTLAACRSPARRSWRIARKNRGLRPSRRAAIARSQRRTRASGRRVRVASVPRASMREPASRRYSTSGRDARARGLTRRPPSRETSPQQGGPRRFLRRGAARQGGRFVEKRSAEAAWWRCSAPNLSRPRRLGLDLALRDLLPVEAGHHAIEQALAHTDEGVALANSHVGRITLADPGRAQRLV
jgi:hypothetical protein